MLIIRVILILALLSAPVCAANYFVRDGASGDCSTSWNGACDSLASAESAASTGDTIYVAEGSYSSTTLAVTNLTVKKCYDGEGTCDEISGWQTSYGDGQATFSGIMTITATGVTVDGGYRGSAWDNAAGYGFALTSSSDGFVIQNDNATISYTSVNPGNAADDAFYIGVSGSGDYLTVDHCHTYNVGRCSILGRDISYGLYEYNWFGDSCLGCSPTTHGEAVSIYSGSNTYNTFRYNIWQDWGNNSGSTGGIMMGDANYTFCYGNVFLADDNFSNNGVVGSWTGYDSTNWRVYNNTFINISATKANILPDALGTFTGSIVRNNIFYNNTDEGIGSTPTQSHQATDGTDFGNNCQTNLTDIFDENSKFALTDATDDGYELTNETVGGLLHTYDKDMLGNTRGTDGIWDRGAYEYTDGETPATPATIQRTTGGASFERSANGAAFE